MDDAGLTDMLRSRLGRVVAIESMGGTAGRTMLYRVNGGECVLKLFYHAPEIKQMRELTAYAFLASSGLPVARLLDWGVLPSGVPWILLSHVPGETIKEIKRRMPGSPARLTDAMATFLAQLHRLPADTSPLFVGKEARATLLQARLTKYAGFVTCAARAHLSERPLWRRASSEMQRLLLDNSAGWARKGVFVHGDFSTRNLLARNTEHGVETTGIIDFERARLGDPAEDLCAVFLEDFCRDESGWQRFLARYCLLAGADSGLRIRFAYFFIGHVAEIATWAPGKDDAYYRAGIAALETVLEWRDEVGKRPR
ncbi:hypothetical protein BTHE68_56560 [Burkholderia sp. THE68]|nr:hypothetical protein BTHE68_56560 [Burkholderia sp. THE68]